MEATKYTEPKERRIIGRNASEGIEPRNINIAQGQRVHDLEASSAACVTGEYVSAVSGSESAAGNLTVHIGTWESHTAPKEAPDKPKRQGRSMAVWQSD